MFRKKMTLSLILVLVLSLAVDAATLNVPADYATIQLAADNAAPGDTIMIAPGIYAGAEIVTPVKIAGSGPSTRITTGLPPWGDCLVVSGAVGTEISNLAIELIDPLSPGFSAGVVVNGSDNCTVRDLQITAPYGVFIPFSNNVVVTDNEISVIDGTGIEALVSDNLVASGNTITGSMDHGIWVDSWWQNLITTNAVITNNTITGEMWCAIHCHQTLNSVVSNNTIDMVMSVPFDGIAVVLVSASSNLDIIDNDYTGCDVPGWTMADGPGSVLLANGTSNSFVFESGNFPPGTGGAKNQVLDLTKELTGTTTNRVIGHPAAFLAEDLNPGIGQRIQELMDQLDALHEPEAERAVRP